eukprot:TRINITY_DN860_c0_g1_i1.p1 TRINITY_DN860_c0_g1~~TRINITY_DN860_c0_g1_i1.p1  ORF type:complete len:788 (-),score=83.21 TRINITY_DN860_c0_g1_i1:15-2378(-)
MSDLSGAILDWYRSNPLPTPPKGTQYDMDPFHGSTRAVDAAWEARLSFCVAAALRLIPTPFNPHLNELLTQWGQWCGLVDESVLLEGCILSSHSHRHAALVHQWKSLLDTIGPMMKEWREEALRLRVGMRIMLLSRIILPSPAFQWYRTRLLDGWISCAPNSKNDSGEEEGEEAPASFLSLNSNSLFPRRLLLMCKSVDKQAQYHQSTPWSHVRRIGGAWCIVLRLLTLRIEHQGLSRCPLHLFTLIFVTIRWIWYLRIISCSEMRVDDQDVEEEGEQEEDLISESLAAFCATLSSNSSSDSTQRPMRQKLGERLCLQWMPLLPAVANPQLNRLIHASATSPFSQTQSLTITSPVHGKTPLKSPAKSKRAVHVDANSLFDHVDSLTDSTSSFSRKSGTHASLSSPHSRQRGLRGPILAPSSSPRTFASDASRKRSRLSEGTSTYADSQISYAENDDDNDDELIVPAKRRRLSVATHQQTQNQAIISEKYTHFKSLSTVASFIRSHLMAQRNTVGELVSDITMAASSFFRCAPLPMCTMACFGAPRNLVETVGLRAWALAVRRCLSGGVQLETDQQQLLMCLLDHFEDQESARKLAMIRVILQCFTQRTQQEWPSQLLLRLRSVCLNSQQDLSTLSLGRDGTMLVWTTYWMVARLDPERGRSGEAEWQQAIPLQAILRSPYCPRSLPFPLLCRQNVILECCDVVECSRSRLGLVGMSNSASAAPTDGDCLPPFNSDSLVDPQRDEIDSAAEEDEEADASAPETEETAVQPLWEDYDDLDDFITWGAAI